MADDLIPISEAAHAEGVTRQTLHRQLQQGVFPHYETVAGLRVRLREVRAGRRANLDPRRVMDQRRARTRRERAAVPRPVRQPATSDEPQVNVYGEDGTVLTRISVSDLLDDCGEWDALERDADAKGGYIRVPLVRQSEVHALIAKLTADALADTPGDRIYLDHLELIASRADAEALLAAYRRGTGEENLAIIRALHRALG
jgi:hypothetical protein